jgi:hypothetical protein
MPTINLNGRCNIWFNIHGCGRANDFSVFPQLYLNDCRFDATRQQLIQKMWPQELPFRRFSIVEWNVIPRRKPLPMIGVLHILTFIISREKGYFADQFQNQMDFVSARSQTMAIYAELWKWFGTIVSLIHISVGRSDLSSMNRLRNQRNSNEKLRLASGICWRTKQQVWRCCWILQ